MEKVRPILMGGGLGWAGSDSILNEFRSISGWAWDSNSGLDFLRSAMTLIDQLDMFSGCYSTTIIQPPERRPLDFPMPSKGGFFQPERREKCSRKKHRLKSST
jgi:hypothetical protein